VGSQQQHQVNKKTNKRRYYVVDMICLLKGIFLREITILDKDYRWVYLFKRKTLEVPFELLNNNYRESDFK
jgi:hypothetical protein